MEYKTRQGYHLNHDNLMIMDQKERQKMIIYYIANHASEKLEPSDRQAYYNSRQPIEQRKQFWSLAFTSTYLFQILRKTPCFNSRIMALASSPFIYYLTNNLVDNNYENQFISSNTLLESLSEKYRFTIFDFAQAKKESHLKALKQQITDEYTIL